MIAADVKLDAGASYTIAATDPVATIKPAVFVDDASPRAGEARLRVVHLAADAPSVDIAPDGADPVVSDLAYPNATGYLDLDGGAYNLEVRVAGSDDVALQLDPVTLRDGMAYSVFAIGSAATEPLGGNALTVVVAEDGMAPPDTSIVGETSVPGSSPSRSFVLVGAAAGAGVFLHRRRFARARGLISFPIAGARPSGTRFVALVRRRRRAPWRASWAGRRAA